MSQAGSTSSHILCTVRATQHMEDMLDEFPLERAVGIRQMKKMIHHYYDFDEKGKILPGRFKNLLQTHACCICILLFLCPCKILQSRRKGKVRKQ